MVIVNAKDAEIIADEKNKSMSNDECLHNVLSDILKAAKNGEYNIEYVGFDNPTIMKKRRGLVLLLEEKGFNVDSFMSSGTAIF